MPTVHLLALGSRGDVVPVLTLAARLQERGRRVVVHGAASYAALGAAAGVPYRGVGDRELLGRTPAARRVVLANVAITYGHLRATYREWSRQVWAEFVQVAAPEDVLLCGLGSAAMARSWQRMGRRAGLLLLADVAPAPLHGSVAGLPARARRRLTWAMAADMSSAPAPGRADELGLPADALPAALCPPNRTLTWAAAPDMSSAPAPARADGLGPLADAEPGPAARPPNRTLTWAAAPDMSSAPATARADGPAPLADAEPGPATRPPNRTPTWATASHMSPAPALARAAGPLPMIVAVSDTLNPGPHPHSAHVVRTGHLIEPGHRLDTATPAHVKIDGRPLVYIGLGSMGDPRGRTLAMFDAAAADVGCRLVTDAAPAADRLDHTSVTGPVDHHALFPHVTGVLHHGGAGTTIAGLLAGRPTAVIPHLGDQFATARTVHALGAGPRPLHRHRLTARSVRRTLEALADPPRAQVAAAAAVAERLAAENGLQRTAVACERLCDGLPLHAT